MKLSEILKSLKKNEYEKLTAPLRETEVEKPQPKDKEIQEKELLPIPEVVYGNAISTVRKMFNVIKTSKEYDAKNLIEAIANIKTLFKYGHRDLLFFIEKSTPDNYLIAHSVNVLILAAFLAFEKKYDDRKINVLMLSAILHDLGMLEFLDLVSTGSKLTSQEFRPVKGHVETGIKEIEKKIVGIPYELKNDITKIIYQIHERTDGSGYPKGIQEIDSESALLRISDIYEALTHKRTWRNRYLPHDAMKILVEMSDKKIDKPTVKFFIEKMSFYPIGSYVKLNTNEIGKIIETNPEAPTRPTLCIILDNNNEKVYNKILDLRVNPAYSIVEAVDETKLKPKDRRFYLELKTQQWWLKK